MKVTLSQAAQIKGLSKEGIRQHILSGNLKASKDGNKYMIDLDDLNKALPTKTPSLNMRMQESEVPQGIPFLPISPEQVFIIAKGEQGIALAKEYLQKNTPLPMSK